MIKLSKSVITDNEKKAVMDVLDREYLGMGQDVLQFEEMLTEYFGRPATCVVNGTAALHLACQAAGIGSGDEVLVQSLTYVASFQAISATGARPVACGVDPVTLTLDLKDAEKRVTSNTKAVMPVHYAGGVGDIDGIYEFAKRHQLRVIEDAAHAFGAEYNGKKVGGFGDVACFSFDGIKNITSGEGGCIVTDDENILKKIKDARLLGVEKDTEKRFQGERSWDFNVSYQGWRYHMSNIMAAIGIEQFKKISSISEKRRQLALYYNNRLSQVKNVRYLPLDYTSVVPHIYVIEIMSSKYRDELREHLMNKGIQTGVHYQPNHLLDMFKCEADKNLLITENISSRILSLPLHTELSFDEVDYICDSLLEAL